MSPDPRSRPDPDALLRKITVEESQARRARLKIFFGFAPGVGKTYRMLQVARDLVSDQKADLVVGLVETHRRRETAVMLLGLELLARRKMEYRGRTLEEFDLDAALARRPQILLLDELAHTNAEGARHAKRWQDVLELLDAGIDVFTTVNVQHVESLNDVVAQITRIQVRETIPDAILDRADEIELVDVAPEELLTRLSEGKVYLPAQAERAVEHFFQKGNLLALRELALRTTAQHVDADVQEYREHHGVERMWAAGERILVCVGPAPSSARLIRAASRMAAGLRAPWVAAYVVAPSSPSEPDQARLETHLRLADSLGGRVVRLSGVRVAEALLDYARKNNVTRIIVGKPTHSELRDRLWGSLLNEVVRGSGDIDVHVIRGDASDTPRNLRVPRLRPTSPVHRYAQAAGLVALTTGIGVSVRQIYAVPDLEVLYLLAVLIAAIRLGRGPSVMASALSVGAYDFFFVPPFHTFAVADVRYVLTFGMMFGVGLTVSELTARIRRQEREARTREERTAVLYALSRELGGTLDAKGAAERVAQRAAEIFGGAVVLFRPSESGGLAPVAAFPPQACLDATEFAVAQWAYEHREHAGLGTDTLPGSRFVCAPLHVGASLLGVLALEPQSRQGLTVEQREFLDTLCRQTASAFERSRLEEESRSIALRAKTEEMRNSLLSAVSHDLRTPLASITGAATSLRHDAELSPITRTELVEAICDEAERMERLIANLLDMTRMEAGVVALKREWVPLEELVVSALTRLEEKLSDRPVTLLIPATLPLISVDPVLLEQLIFNLLENAAKYTPALSPLEVAASLENRTLRLEIRDRGPGLQPGEEERVFERFRRGEHLGVGGIGLGLAICRAIANAHGGTVSAENRCGGGSLFRVTLPLLGTAPIVLIPEVEP